MRDTAGPESHEALRAALLGHYDRHARDLPWRDERDPYRILVSEVMLQQTRVETVKGYYDAWLARFPTVQTLADADEDDVLKAWEGLGYYRRARNLHGAARVVRDRFGGDLPTTFRELGALPGVGEYTAGAVSSIAFGVPVPAVDGNVRRVLCRLFDIAEPGATWLRDTAGSLVDPERPGDWNQALMELGATVCTPRSPDCDACPVAEWCASREAGTQLERPARKMRRAVRSERIALAVLHAGGRVLLEKRPADGLLAGMWALPERTLPDGPSATADELAAARAAALEVADELGLEGAGDPVALPARAHRFTHLEARYLPWAIEVCRPEPEGQIPIRGNDSRDGSSPRVVEWVEPEGYGDLALPKAQRSVLESWVDESMVQGT